MEAPHLTLSPFGEREQKRSLPRGRGTLSLVREGQGEGARNQIPSNIRAGSSMHRLIVTRHCTASRPSMMRWS